MIPIIPELPFDGSLLRGPRFQFGNGHREIATHLAGDRNDGMAKGFRFQNGNVVHLSIGIGYEKQKLP